jgi:hypothetical protein
MIRKLTKPILVIGPLLLLILLYWPALTGTPIWDDTAFWFDDPVMGPSMSYGTIWQNFAWPLSVSIQKVLLSLLERHYLSYHLLNLGLHLFNSFLVYRLGLFLKLRYPILLFFAFLLHPAAVITTAWMIQLKTLLCFSFALGALLAFLKGEEDRRWTLFSWLLFVASIASKSASIPLSLIILGISWHKHRWRRLHLVLPFFLLAGWGTGRVLSSSITAEGTEKAAKMTKLKVAPSDDVFKESVSESEVIISEPEVIAKPEVITKPEVIARPEEMPKSETVQANSEVHEIPAKDLGDKAIPDPELSHSNAQSSSSFSLNIDVELVAQTLNYYFWQVLLPIHNQPVKGPNYQRAHAMEVIHILFLILLIITLWGTMELGLLISAHILLLPFLGLLPAPFMNVTWVSDQHLYLALPALLGFWLLLIDRFMDPRILVMPVALITLFSWRTQVATSYYRNNITFYEASLVYNPINIPIAYNISIVWLSSGQLERAREKLEFIYEFGKEDPLVRENIYYPLIVDLYSKLQDISEDKK